VYSKQHDEQQRTTNCWHFNASATQLCTAAQRPENRALFQCCLHPLLQTCRRYCLQLQQPAQAIVVAARYMPHSTQPHELLHLLLLQTFLLLPLLLLL
jgi:hypothetical protein